MKKHISFATQLYVNSFRLFNFLVGPRSEDFEEARREFVLNVILIGIITGVLVALVQNITYFFKDIQSPGAISPYITSGFLFIFLYLLRLSRVGNYKLAAKVLVIILLFIPFYTILKWGIAVPAALLAYALIVVVSGILIDSRFAFIITGFIVIFNIVVKYLHFQNIILPDYTWKNRGEGVGDALILNAILCILAIVSWLFNRQSEKAFIRASKMELALKKERDTLEQKVEERTREIKQVRMEKLASLNHMAEIGRLTAGFFHDLVNPLNLVSLNLDRLSTHNRLRNKQFLSENKIMLERAIKGTKHLSQFIDTARRQIRDQQMYEPFDLIKEINDVIAMLSHKAKNAKVTIIFVPKISITILGNPLRFNQIVSNLISNAIDAHDRKPPKKSTATIEICLSKNSGWAILTVSDNGMGIPNTVLPNIFEPFFTTKKDGKGIGIGLTICKDIIEREFKGEIKVESRINDRTVFTIRLPIKNVDFHKVIT